MSYKPKHCCQCGEKIERTVWKPWTSRRFCELCETELGIYDLMSKAIVIVSILIGFIGLVNFFGKTDKLSEISSKQNATLLQKKDANVIIPKNAPQTLTNGYVQNLVPLQSSVPVANPKPPKILSADNLKQTNITEPQEITYFCGAQTKKGTPCSRRVKGGGRCWQHPGQPAMLPKEKLIAGK